MKISDFRDKKITILGLGLHGGAVAAARFFYEAGAQVVVTDIKSKEELLPSVEKLRDCKNIKFVFNQHRPEDFSKADMVVKNPGVPWNNKYIEIALSSGVPVEIDSSLFFKLCKNTIVGVTGTKGKTTTSSLIFEILKAGGKNPIQVGIGQTSVLDKLNDLKNDSVVVFELSSWRLSAMGKYQISPQIGVITNIYPDHLNYYKDIDEYVRDKKYIFESQKQDDFCVMNVDDEVVASMEPEVKSQVIKISKNKPETGKSVYILEGGIYLNDGVDEKKIIDCADIQLRGKHNIHNILLSIGSAYAAGVSVSAMKKGILNFKGVPHRLEFVRDLEGVKYFNDSAATMPEAAVFGINSFSEPIVLIAGGSDKNLDMSEFGKIIAQKVKIAVLIRGLATEKILHSAQKYLEKTEFERRFKVVDSMKKAVELAKLEADDGDVVLLSPGAASFGLFTNEFDRGDQFKAAVKVLK